MILLGFVLNALADFGSTERNVSQNRGVDQTRKVGGSFVRRRQRPPIPPPYAVQMEPLIKYSQRDPLYHEKMKNSTINTYTQEDHDTEPSNNIAEYVSPEGYDHGYSPYYSEPEPIIEIIIKESNESLPAPTVPSIPTRPPTKEPVHVFYVKYKKNPNASGKDGESDIIYDPPVPALTSHQSDIVEEDHEALTREDTYVVPSTSPQPTTTLRTIIRPDSETYHGSGLKVTFESPDSHSYDRSDIDRNSSEASNGPYDGAQKRESTEQPVKSHYFKRQQGPYIPQYQSQPNLHPPSEHQRHYQQQHFGPPPQGPQYRENQKPPQHQHLQQQTAFRPQHSYNRPPFQQNGQNGLSQQQQASHQYQINQPPNNNDHKQRPVPSPQPPYKLGSSTPNYAVNNNFGDAQQQHLRFQPTLAAQIEQYQQHKQFLYQQNLRQQALQQSNREQQGSHQQGNHESNNHRPSPTATNRPNNPTSQNFGQYRPSQPIEIQPSIPVQLQNQNSPQLSHPSKESHTKSQQLNFAQIPTTTQIKNEYNSRRKVQQHSVPTASPQLGFNSKPSYTTSASSQASLTQSQNPYIPSHTNHAKHAQTPQSGYQQDNLFSRNQLQPSQSPNEPNDFLRIPHQSFKQSHFGSGGEIVKSISQLEAHQIQSAQKNAAKQNYQQSKEEPGSNFNANINYNTENSYHPENHRYGPVEVTSTPRPLRPNYTSRTSTTALPRTRPTKVYSLIPSTTEPPTANEESTESKEPTQEEIEKKKANLAALPDEVPDDLREQLLSSGILGNADISILDYDKVGDIPIESLPPEALENLYGAGSEPVASVVRPDSPPEKQPVEMKVVRYNKEESKDVADTYVKDGAIHLDPVVLNDSRYNRYLPLKVSGAHFPLPDAPQLKGRIVNSVVVLAPVDYDFIKEQEDSDVDRAGRAVQVQGVHFLAGGALKGVVKDPSTENFKKWLEKEKETPTEQQSVILLVTRSAENENAKEKKDMDIYMYEVTSEKVSKVRGELSSAFVEVAEANSESEEIEELAPQPGTTALPTTNV